MKEEVTGFLADVAYNKNFLDENWGMYGDVG